MNRPSGLGRGLGALIPTDVVGEATAEYLEIPVGDIEPNSYQPRTSFDEEALAGLTASIRELGVLQPVLVRPDGDRYQLIAGERRWRAAKRAGLSHIPAIVRHVEEAGLLQQAVVENLHRTDLNPLDEAAAYQQLVDDFAMTQDEVAERVGKSRSAVTNTLRLLQLAPVVQRMLSDGDLSAGHARALLAVDDADDQVQLAERVVADGLSVRETERLSRGEETESTDLPKPKPKADAPLRPRVSEPGVLELEEMLAEQLSTHVRISMTKQRGTIAVSFADLDDLERIYRLISGLGTP